MSMFPDLLPHPALAISLKGEIRSLRMVPESGYPGYGAYVSPSRYWGERLGIEGIYKTYDSVLGDRHEAIQDELFDLPKRLISEEARDARVFELYEALVDAYPKLPREVVLTARQAAAVAHGCVSQFCPDDIRFFITGQTERDKPRWRKRKAVVERLIGGWHLEWCPSYKTLDLIESAMGFDFD